MRERGDRQKWRWCHVTGVTLSAMEDSVVRGKWKKEKGRKKKEDGEHVTMRVSGNGSVEEGRREIEEKKNLLNPQNGKQKWKR